MTAEFAAAVPAAVIVLALCLGAVRVGGEQLRLASAVHDAARMAGRGEPGADAIVPSEVRGATVTFSRHGGLVCATARLPAPLTRLVRVAIRASACALDEAGSGGGP